MTQSELNQQIAKQTGESIAEIARRGFTILTELPQDSDEVRLQSKDVAVAIGSCRKQKCSFSDFREPQDY